MHTYLYFDNFLKNLSVIFQSPNNQIPIIESELKNFGINYELKNFFDDIYKVVGAASGNGLNNRDFTVEIKDTLEVNLGCLKPTVTYNKRCAIVSGKVEITPDGYSAREIDYGMGGCNCDFSVTINGKSYFVVVP
mgnify:CR=1 FL=1